MQKKILFFFIICMLFLSDYLLHTFNNHYQLEAYVPIQKKLYTLKKKHIHNNAPANFNPLTKKKGYFFVHPGKLPVSGLFQFKEDAQLKIYFSFKKGSKKGDILYTVKKNYHIVQSIHVTANKKQKSLTLSVNPKDRIEIIADKNKDLSQDWGMVKIEQTTSLYTLKNLTIPFLWTLALVALFFRGYIYLFLDAYLVWSIFIISHQLNFSPVTYTESLLYTLFIFFYLFCAILLHQFLTRFKFSAFFTFILSLSIYLIPLLTIVYIINFNAHMTESILYAIFQTNSHESFEFVSTMISIWSILLIIGILLLSIILAFMQARTKTISLDTSLLLLLIASFGLLFFTSYPKLKIPNFFIHSSLKYYNELQSFKKAQTLRNSGSIDFNASKSQTGETYLVVIGESLNKNHMGIYHYFRETTPLLSKIEQNNDMLLFNNVYANYVQTSPALTFALTEANQYNHKKFYDAPSILDILNKAQIETYWITNQELYGNWDNFISIIAKESQYIIPLNHHIASKTYDIPTHHYDAAVIKETKKILLKKTNKNRVIFIHLMGNHVAYASRYPKEYTLYKGKSSYKDYGKAAKQKSYYNRSNINLYDNSVHYNDYVVASLLKTLQKESGANGFIYFSDHSDDVASGLAHNPSKYTYPMTEIPMIAWFSKEYKTLYAKKYNIFSSHQDKLFTNDLIYDTLIGIMDIKTASYAPIYDLSSNTYSITESNALLEHGKKHFTEKKNYLYWERYNSNQWKKQYPRIYILPSHINTPAMLNETTRYALDSIQIDVYFKKRLYIGAEKGKIGYSLKEYFSFLTKSKIKNIHMTLHNITQNNAKNILNELEALNSDYSFKDNCTLIIKNQEKTIFQTLQHNNWQLSYRLSHIEKITQITPDSLKKVALHTINTINSLPITSLTFSYKDYTFVMQYLKGKLKKSILFHIDVTPAHSLDNKNLLDRLKKFTKDSSIDTLYIKFKSPYHL